MSSRRHQPTFAERLSLEQKISPEKFDRYVLKRCLRAPLRWLYRPLGFAFADFLEPDLQCVRTIGTLRSTREAENELAEFSYHPRNRQFFRRILRQRLSTHKVHRLLRGLPRPK